MPTVSRYRGPRRKRGQGKSDFGIGRTKRVRRVNFLVWAYICHLAGDRCLKCGAAGLMTVDHIRALGAGGTNIIENVQPLCSKCNGSKGREYADYRNEAIKSFLRLTRGRINLIAFLHWRQTGGGYVPRPYPVPEDFDVTVQAGGNGRANLGNGRRAVGAFKLEAYIPQAVRESLGLGTTEIGDGSSVLLCEPG